MQKTMGSHIACVVGSLRMKTIKKNNKVKVYQSLPLR